MGKGESENFIFKSKNPRSVNRKSGGIGIYVKNELFDQVEFVDENMCEGACMLYLKEQVLGKKSLIIVCYAEPDSSVYFKPSCFDDLEEDLINYYSTKSTFGTRK